jgi:hypothetical protein
MQRSVPPFFGRFVCALNGHVWGTWQPASALPTRARQCQRCGKRESFWLSTNLTGGRMMTRIPAIEMEHDKPTVIQRSWGALTAGVEWLVGLLAVAARTVAGWLTGARRACLRVVPHWRYAKYVARHKRFVYVAGRQLKAPWWRLVIHDCSKLGRAEWTPYVHTFYRPDIPRSEKQEAFDRAWLHHQHHNAHHWQHWVLRQDDGELIVLEMPERFAREMVADWCGAGRAITGRWDAQGWYASGAGAKMELHPATRLLVERLLTEESPQ